MTELGKALALSVVLGLVSGSALSSLVTRLAGRRRWSSGRSRCHNCGAVLGGFELFPLLSFFLSGRRCRHCKKPISWFYPLIEALTAGLFVLWALKVEGSWASTGSVGQKLGLLVMGWLLISAWVGIFFIDLKKQIIPDSLLVLGSLTMLGAWVVFGASLSAFSSTGDLWISVGYRELAPTFLASIGAAIGSAIFFGAIHILGKAKSLGMGDVKLAGALGFLHGFPNVVSVIALASIAGVLFAVPQLARGRLHMKSRLPFGPFLVGASLFFLLI